MYSFAQKWNQLRKVGHRFRGHDTNIIAGKVAAFLCFGYVITLRTYAVACSGSLHKHTWCSSARPPWDLRSFELCHLCMVTVTYCTCTNHLNVYKQLNIFPPLFFVLLFFDQVVTFATVLRYFLAPPVIMRFGQTDQRKNTCFIVLVCFLATSLKKKTRMNVLTRSILRVSSPNVCDCPARRSL